MSGLLQHEADTARQAIPRRLFLFETLLAGLRQSIEARAAVVLGRAPVGGDPALAFEALQSGVERALLDLQDLVRQLADALRNRPAVQRLERDRFHDQQVDGALNEVGRLPHDYLQESIAALL